MTHARRLSNKVAWAIVAIGCVFSFLAMFSIGVFILMATCVFTAIVVLLERRDPVLPMYDLAPRALLPAFFALAIGVPFTVDRIASPYCDYGSDSAEPAGCTDALAWIGPGLIVGALLIFGALAAYWARSRR